MQEKGQASRSQEVESLLNSTYIFLPIDLYQSVNNTCTHLVPTTLSSSSPTQFKSFDSQLSRTPHQVLSHYSFLFYSLSSSYQRPQQPEAIKWTHKLSEFHSIKFSSIHHMKVTPTTLCTRLKSTSLIQSYIKSGQTRTL